jgi:hypothetical protein
MKKKVTTNNKEDNDELLYVPTYTNDRIPEILVIRRCPYCKVILKGALDGYGKTKEYCSEWCWEMENPPNIHECTSCGMATLPIPRSNGKTSGVYRRLCDECYKLKYGHYYIHKDRLSDL